MNKETRPYQICSECVMDTSDPDITFNNQGVCHYHDHYKRLESTLVIGGEAGQAKLMQIADTIRTAGKGRPYDCLIGISGGVDSSYVAYLAKKLGLRPLCVHLDNGWNSELAVKNIEQVINKVGFDLHTHVINWEEFRDLQLSFFKASVANVEIPTDHAIVATMYKAAVKYGIKYILSGNNVATESILPPAWGYDFMDWKHINAIHSIFGSERLTTYPHFSFSKYLYYILGRQIKNIRILNYCDYSKQKALEVLTEKLGWRYYGGKHYESRFTRFFQGHYLPKKFGYDKRRGHLSSLIVTGEITRDEALKELEKPPYPESEQASDLTFLLKKLGLTSEDWKKIMSAPCKNFSDYPSNYALFSLIRRLRGTSKEKTRAKAPDRLENVIAEVVNE